MSQTRLLDLLNAQGGVGVLSPLVAQKFATFNALTTSGIAVGGPEADLLMTGGSQDQGLAYINKVDTTEFNHSSDDYEQKGKTGKITSGRYNAHRFDLNWGWTHTDLLKMITKFDINGHLLSTAIPTYWNEVAENFAVASVKGSLAADADLTVDGGALPFSVEMIIDAEVELDGPAENLFVSKRTLAKLKKANAAAYVGPKSDVNIHFAKYADYNLIVTEAFGDDVTVIASNGALVFSTGVVPGEIAMEYKRDADAGNGGGGEVLRTRRSIVTQVQGMSYVGEIDGVAIEKPTLAQLANADMWTRKGDLSLIGIRAIKHAA
ncbi:hypothetical protein CA235_11190 [Sphingomonas sp. ABOLF]|uniref:hypothetical protein n=1 Tax=Sphingomonas sp. ABOLF TaxID=1985879 RepID=UPI000F7E712E|nr:hypothetical protein [Sphingomonas sp. ABOLF]RSV14636.1 hypothetical protein CA235_11190 [Sphingomonas sp. ABOLF]GLK19238.1 hypothetical protein GCM10017606_00640 [Microbacterium terregens]